MSISWNSGRIPGRIWRLGEKGGGGKERRGVDGLTDAVDECGVHRSAETSAGSQLAGREAVDG